MRCTCKHSLVVLDLREHIQHRRCKDSNSGSYNPSIIPLYGDLFTRELTFKWKKENNIYISNLNLSSFLNFWIFFANCSKLLSKYPHDIPIILVAAMNLTWRQSQAAGHSQWVLATRGLDPSFAGYCNNINFCLLLTIPTIG